MMHAAGALDWSALSRWCTLTVLGTSAGLWAAQATPVVPAEPAGPFIEEGFPFLATPVDLRPAEASPGGKSAEAGKGANVAVRGIVLPLAGGACVAFDQDLLRCAGVWATATAPVTLRTMAQTSYADGHRKGGAEKPRPTGPLLLATGMHPGAAADLAALFEDPRPTGRHGDVGRGPLPPERARFSGIALAGGTAPGGRGIAVLTYRVGDADLREWYDGVPLPNGTPPEAATGWVRHVAVSAHAGTVFLALGAASEGGSASPWTLSADGRTASATMRRQRLELTRSGADLTLLVHQGELVARVEPATTPVRLDFRFIVAPIGADRPATTTASGEPGPFIPRWPDSLPVASTLASLHRTGLTLDRIGLPAPNPWKRRVRAADIAFLDADRAAVVTFDGDVWIVTGLADEALAHVRWRRYASGLNEPLSVAVVQGVVQVATRNGVIRLHDRSGRGEADWYENFCDLGIQSQSSRAFPLDMDVGPDGATYVTQGAIASEGVGRKTPGATPGHFDFGEHQGTVLKIAPDGRSLSVFSRGGREPYVSVDPTTGVVTGSDQQGQFIPSSVCYLIRPGSEFGFGEDQPAHLTPPLVWVPYTEDTSSSSSFWIRSPGMGPFDGGLIHLSYGTGQPFLISPDLTAPIPQGAVIPMGLKTEIPLLQGRMHPGGKSAYLCGFQVYDSRAREMWGLGRLRRDDQPVTIPVAATSCEKGVVITFAAPLAPDSVVADQVTATAWNYKRSRGYGSGRYTAKGTSGTDRLTIGQVALSQDKRSLFVHLPDLAPAMQVEVRFNVRLEGLPPAEGAAKDPGVVYFTIHQLRPLDLAAAGFPGLDLSRRIATTQAVREEPPTIAQGEALSQSMGCTACHATEAGQEGKTGPSWKGLFGSPVTCTDGTTAVADEAYLRESILDPDKRIVQGYQQGMATYQGILTDRQIDAVILYIRSLR